VPFNYWGDTLYFISLVKSIVSGGWIWEIPQLGAPFGLKITAFPSNLTTDGFFIKLIASFVSEAGLALNLF